MVIEKSTFGGQITHSPRVENYPGFVSLSGTELADKLIEQVLEQGADIELDCVTKVLKTDGNFAVKCENSEFSAKSVIIATGSHHRQLGLPKENDFIGEGISYCAVCDGAFYKGQEVCVIGGGNTALQEAVMLSDICKKVYIVQNLDFLTGEQKLADDISTRENVEVILSSTVEEILGDESFLGVLINQNGEKRELKVDGAFVAIGQKPENEPFSEVVKLDEWGYIISGEDCTPKDTGNGIFVAGDCRTKSVRQVATAISDGAVAALCACKYVDSV